jgi:hypothetical protein
MRFNVASACGLPGPVENTWEKFHQAFEDAGCDIALIDSEGWVDRAVLEAVFPGQTVGRIAIRDDFWRQYDAVTGRDHTKRQINYLMPKVLALAGWPVMSGPAIPRSTIDACANEAAAVSRSLGGGRRPQRIITNQGSGSVY